MITQAQIATLSAREDELLDLDFAAWERLRWRVEAGERPPGTSELAARLWAAGSTTARAWRRLLTGPRGRLRLAEGEAGRAAAWLAGLLSGVLVVPTPLTVAAVAPLMESLRGLGATVRSYPTGVVLRCDVGGCIDAAELVLWWGREPSADTTVRATVAWDVAGWCERQALAQLAIPETFGGREGTRPLNPS